MHADGKNDCVFSFTIGKINSIIDIMTDAKSRLTSSAVQAPVVDRMFTKISEEI